MIDNNLEVNFIDDRVLMVFQVLNLQNFQTSRRKNLGYIELDEFIDLLIFVVLP